MGISIAHQTIVFLLSVMIGAGISSFYDIFRTIRKRIRHINFVVMIEDILFWLVAFVSIFVFIYNANSGELRVFLLIGAFIGVFLYFAIFSRFVRKVFELAFTIAEKILYIILRPFVLILRPFTAKLKMRIGKSGNLAEKVKKVFKFKMKSAILSLGVRKKKKSLPNDEN